QVVGVAPEGDVTTVAADRRVAAGAVGRDAAGAHRHSAVAPAQPHQLEVDRHILASGDGHRVGCGGRDAGAGGLDLVDALGDALDDVRTVGAGGCLERHR